MLNGVILSLLSIPKGLQFFKDSLYPLLRQVNNKLIKLKIKSSLLSQSHQKIQQRESYYLIESKLLTLRL